MVYKLTIFMFTLLLLSCAPKVSNKTEDTSLTPKVSATKVVDMFLRSLKEEKYEDAYDYIYTVNSDREGYASTLKNLGIRLIDYKILGTQLFKRSAIVVAELKISYRTEKTGEPVIRTRRTKYDLSIIDREWKIVKDTCIENCE